MIRDFYKIKVEKDKLHRAFSKLNSLYALIPNTSGCMENNCKDGGCKSWCCLTPDSRIFTPYGLRPIKEIQEGDAVFTKDGLRTVAKTGNRTIDEEIITITTCYGRKLKLTKDHKVLVDLIKRKSRYKLNCSRFVEADCLKSKNGKWDGSEGHYVVFPKISLINNDDIIKTSIDKWVKKIYVNTDSGLCYTSSQQKGNPIKNSFELNEDFVWILGLFLAEGTTSRATVDFHMHADENQLQNKIELFAKSFGVSCTHKINKGKSKTVRVFSNVLARFFKEVCGSGCENKKIINELFNMILCKKSLREALHNGYYDGDGSHKLAKKISYSCTTTSTELMYQLLMLNHLNNQFPVMCYFTPKDNKPFYTLSISDGDFNDYVETDVDFRIPIRKIEKERYRGLVYDIEIENGESFLTEIGEVHNCAIQSPQMLYVEFLHTLDSMLKNWTIEQISEIIDRSVYHYVTDFPIKGCIFFNRDTNLCNCHKSRSYNCFLPDTWVYTKCGPKFIKDILAGDYIYGSDGNLHKVIATSTRIHSGEVYNIRHCGNYIDCWCTPEHQWLSILNKDRRQFYKKEKQWIEAKDLVEKKQHKEGSYLIFPRYFEDNEKLERLDVLDYIKAQDNYGLLTPFTSGNMCEPQSIPRFFEMDEDFLFMFGIYLAEGSSNSQSTSFSMHKEEKEHLNRIEKYLNNLNIKTHWSTIVHSSNLISLRVDSCLFARLMKALGGGNAVEKRIDENLFALLSNSQKKSIFDGWNIGDGRKKIREGEISAISISQKLIMQMCFIVFCDGNFARIYSYKNQKRGNISYELHVFPTDNGIKARIGQGTKNIFNDNNTFIPAQQFETKMYNGAVVDIQVEGVESFITSSGIVHNCRIYGITPYEEFHPRYLRMVEKYKGVVGAVIKDQCDLVKPDKPVNEKDTDNWWNKLVDIEHFIGIQKNLINDGDGGSYRMPHDHIIYYFLSDDILEGLQHIRLSDLTDEQKRKAADEYLVQFHNKLKKLQK